MGTKQHVLEQRSLLEGRQTFVIEEEHLLWRSKRLLSLREARIPLNAFDSEPVTYRQLSYKALIGAIILSVFEILLLFGGKENLAKALPGAILVGIGLLYCAVILIRTAPKRLYFSNRAGLVVLALRTDLPDAKSVDAFTQLLKEAIRTWIEPPLQSEGSIAREIARLHALFVSGALAQVEFDELKRELIASTRNRKIGFS